MKYNLENLHWQEFERLVSFQITPDKRLLLLSVAVSQTSDADSVEKSFLSLLRECNQQPSVLFETFIDELDGSIIKRIEYLDQAF